MQIHMVLIIGTFNQIRTGNFNIRNDDILYVGIFSRKIAKIISEIIYTIRSAGVIGSLLLTGKPLPDFIGVIMQRGEIYSLVYRNIDRGK